MEKLTRKSNDLLEQPASQASFVQGLTFRMSIGIIVFISLVMLANYLVTQTRGREVIVEQADKLNHAIGEKIILKLHQRLASTESLTLSLAKLGLVLTKNSSTFHQVIPQVINQAGMENIVAGGGIWPEPFTFKEDTERYSFFWGRNDAGKLVFYDDYNDPDGSGYHNEEWYVPAKYLKPGSVYWSKSYMDPYSLEPMVTCSVPMWEGGVFKGVATIDLKLIGLSEFMSKQAQLINGYAFALDRNDRLLSFPNIEGGASKVIDFKVFDKHAYPTLQELVDSNSSFKSIKDELDRIIVDSPEGKPDDLKQIGELGKRLAHESHQIDLEEASRIATLLLEGGHGLHRYQQLSIPYDPILEEESSVSVLGMKGIGWKVIIAMPAKYSNAVVYKITEGMLSLLFILLSAAALIYMLFFNSVFLVPVNKLTHQIRKLVSREDYVTKLNVRGADELSQLASWFNIRTAQLGDALDNLQTRNTELIDAREVAEQANRSKNIFLASMSHDIRTPMNAIIGMSDVLAKTKLESEQENYVRVINTSAQALLALINDIMDFSKIEANQLDLETIPFDFRHVIDDCADLIAFQTLEKHLEFVYYLSPEIHRHVLGDPNRIRQIILNLAGNAVKFTSSGRVELWLEMTYQTDDYSQLLIEVRDTGIGLSTLAQGSLFTPFSQGDSSTTRKYGGTGLGLTISKHLAELMDGSIDFRSEGGVGTTFTFKLKLRSEPHQNTRISNPVLANQEVVILGQNHFQNTVLEQYSKAMGMGCKTVHSVQTWLAELETRKTENITTVCADLGLIGDAKVLAQRLPEDLVAHKFILLASSDDRADIDLSVLPEVLVPKFLGLPLKFDSLEKAFLIDIQSVSKLKKQLDTKKISNITTDSALSRLSTKRILVVEDNKVNQQVLMIMLGYLGLTAELASDGVEAVEAVKSKDYDLILMDWQMPRMDGLEATRKIRALKGEQGPVIIAVTANAMSGDIDKCLDAGMDDYLSKPIQKDILESTLRRWLSTSL